jgi:hypothetical protein
MGLRCGGGADSPRPVFLQDQRKGRTLMLAGAIASTAVQMHALSFGGIQ